MKAVVAAFNQEKALVGAFSVIVQLHRLIVYSTNWKTRTGQTLSECHPLASSRSEDCSLVSGGCWGPTPDRRQFCEMTRPWKLRLSNITFLVWAVFVVPTFHFLFLLLFTSSFFLWCAHYIQMFHVTFIGDLSTKPNLNLCLTFNVFPLNFNCVIRIKDDS